MSVRTARLKRLTGSDFRLSTRDQKFLKDLSCVRIIDLDDADRFHYRDNTSGAKRRLDKLVEKGLLQAVDYQVPNKGTSRAYSFASKKIAKVYGSGLPPLGRRNAFHEVITSRIFFAEGRPDSFKLESDMSASDFEMFRRLGESKSEIARPDAYYIDQSGSVVAVEADSGQYNKRQIQEKMNAWAGIKQVWGQPIKRNSAVENYSNVTLHRF